MIKFFYEKPVGLRKVLIFIFLCFLSVNSVFAQITINVNNKPISEILKEIEKKSEHKFFYNSDFTALSSIKSINAENATLNSVLEQLFEGTGITWEKKDNLIVLTSAELKNSTRQTNNVTITGTVRDENNQGIAGATIFVQGTSNWVTTGANGEYTITATPGSVIKYTFVSYQPREITVGNQTEINVKLIQEINLMDEVVIVGYGVQKKVNLSGSVATVSSKTIKDRPITSIGQALQGSVANMNVTIASGSANSSPSFNIRGYTSLSKTSKPLVVIDGIVSDAEVLNRLNSTDVESITILKDAASSAIYGSRAAFGVILVTTKSGKTEKLTINYNNSFVWRTLTKSPEIITDPYMVAQTRNTMSAGWYNLYDEEELAYAKRRSEDPSVSPYFLKPDGEYSYFGSTDWIDEAYKKSAMSTNHSIDISGKSDRASYFFSGSYYYQDGMIKYGSDKYNRYSVRSKLNFKLTDFWSIGNNTNIIISDYESPRYLGSSYFWEIIRSNPTDVTTNPDGTWTETGAYTLGRMRDGGRKKQDDITLSTQFDTQLDIIKNVFFIKGNFAYNAKIRNINSHTIPIAYYTGPNLSALYHDPISGASGDNTKERHITFDVYGTFMKSFNKHAVSAVAGFNQEEYRSEKMSAGRDELISSSIPSWGQAIGDKSVGHSIGTWALRGAFGRLNYTFDNKYIVEFNGRYDGTSRFPKNDRFTFNPSVSAAWVVSNEGFFKPVKNIVSFLKLKGSYGSLGNQDVADYAYIATMKSGAKTGPILDGKQPTWVSASGLVSNSLTWEKVIVSNFAVEANFLADRLTFVGEIYKRQTKDMLTAGQDLPSVLGTDVPESNAADLETKGWEITLGWKDKFEVGSKPFFYSVGFNLADSKARITKFVNKTGSLSNHYVGKEMGEIWGMQTEGFFTSQEDITAHTSQSLVTSYPGTRPIATGDIKFKNRNNDAEISSGKWTLEDPGDYYIIGNTSSRYTFGLTLGAEWNGFDLSAFFQGVGKKDYAPGSGDLYFFGIYSQPWANTTYGNYYDRWTPETPDGYFPRFKSYVADSGGKELGIPQTKYLQNAAYIRLKNLTVGYTIPEKITQKIKIDRIRIFFSGDNLFEKSGLYKHYKIDPEGLGGQMYPFQRYYSFGMNLTF